VDASEQETDMHFRITIADTIYYTHDELAGAQSDALDHARELTRAVGQPVRVTVHKMGHSVRDDLGRDVTPAFWVGSAVGRIENKVAFVSWVPASAKKAMPVKTRVAA
jgi:hypothetical protein